MAMSEFRKLNGMKLEAEQKIKELEIRADNHIMTIRTLIDPLLDFKEMEVDRAEQAMKSLKVLHTKIKTELETIRKIKERIGNG